MGLSARRRRRNARNQEASTSRGCVDWWSGTSGPAGLPEDNSRERTPGTPLLDLRVSTDRRLAPDRMKLGILRFRMRSRCPTPTIGWLVDPSMRRVSTFLTLDVTHCPMRFGIPSASAAEAVARVRIPARTKSFMAPPICYWVRQRRCGRPLSLSSRRLQSYCWRAEKPLQIKNQQASLSSLSCHPARQRTTRWNLALQRPWLASKRGSLKKYRRIAGSRVQAGTARQSASPPLSLSGPIAHELQFERRIVWSQASAGAAAMRPMIASPRSFTVFAPCLAIRWPCCVSPIPARAACERTN